MTDYGLDLAVIGNGRTAALLDPSSRIVWWCMPRYDGDPVFCRLLAGNEDKGFTDVLLDGQVETRSDYVRNTAIVVTELIDDKGGAVRITDFAPRFRSSAAPFARPNSCASLSRSAACRASPFASVRPIVTASRLPSRSSGSNHIRYWRDEVPVRLTTDAPLSYIENEASFVLTRPVHLVFGTDEPFEGSLETTCRDFCERTRDYWLEWVRRLAFSIDWQDEIIRAGITLKLCNYEETGAIVAALTTSIPEVPGSGRNWDYRFCWMRDAFFVVQRIESHRRDAHHGGFHLLYPERRRGPRRTGAAALRGCAYRCARGANGSGACGIWRRWTGADRQRGGQSEPARRLRQHHHGGDADVLRSQVASPG